MDDKIKILRKNGYFHFPLFTLFIRRIDKDNIAWKIRPGKHYNPEITKLIHTN